ncbi:uracil-DNA glycosylase [Ancylostoma duodenale]|uniref:Uracil-DNA glycosylase n=1 Tax=Ancylostoma duodenale TaxID=51022 RepID=A0A0C2D9N8_9BILA|nr:uracil-DNA glycosylase [Ancylostoma duodenale]
MFLRALKRKADTAAPVSTSAGDTEKKMKLDQNEKENVGTSSESPSVYTSSASFSLYPTTGIFSLYPLLKEKRWRSVLSEEFNMKYMRDIEEFLRNQYAKKVPIFPPREEIFSAFNLTPIDKIRVVIIGQDPYHGVGQAHGLSFSVKKGVPPPPSLKNIYKELSTDIPGFVIPNHGFLEKWALQGVFMLNATLTVESGKANSHEKIGWQRFTDKVISLVSAMTNGVVFLLWGGFAQKKEIMIDKKKHAVIKTAHPSPLSARKWFGCKCFSRANAELTRMGREPIDWTSL